MVSGISHLTFIVRDLARVAEFFETIFGAETVYESGGETFSLSPERFFIIGGVWVCVMEGEAPSERTYTHAAFKIPEAEFDAFRARVEALGVDILPPRPRVGGEGRSLYFYDYDNHLFELHTGTLAERLARYARGRQG